MKKFFLLFLVFSLFTLLGFFLFKFGRQDDLVKEKDNQLISKKDEFGKPAKRLLANREALPLEKIRDFSLERLAVSKGIEGLNETDKYVEEIAAKDTSSQITEEQISNYQTYVTPNDSAVKQIAQIGNYEKIYQTAVDWVWVEDTILNGSEEKWLMPNFFLTQTPFLSTNPVKGKVASDCESQAYTLVSALRSAGMAAENVRVVTGKVDFGGKIGGHAWVEVYDDQSKDWFQLEATSGSYYDSKTGKLVVSAGLPYDYFKNYRYPSVVKWTIFNDKYFFDLTRNEGVAPDNWFDEDTITKKDDPRNINYTIPDSLRKLRSNRAEVLRKKLLDINQLNSRKDRLINSQRK